MKDLTLNTLAIIAAFFAVAATGQEPKQSDPTAQAPEIVETAEKVETSETGSNPDTPENTVAQPLTPKEQIARFYLYCKEDHATEGLEEMLAANPFITEADSIRVSEGFGKLVTEMGSFLDYEVRKETKISKRTVVIRCIAHFEQQPFSNEYTFYDPGEGNWRLVHLRYDGNLASMFLEDIRSGKVLESSVAPPKEQ